MDGESWHPFARGERLERTGASNARNYPEGEMMSVSRTRWFAVAVVLLVTSLSAADGAQGVSFGVNIMLGGRYDDLRMCVGSSAGAKGGPIADIMLDARVHIDEYTAVGLKLPVFRPLLFAIAFDMLQFEPEVFVERTFEISDDAAFVLGPGLGISLHYGPDYETSSDDPDPEPFFAAGPLVSCLVGVQFENDSGLLRILGVRPFYTPLFVRDRPTGTVIGASLEGHLDFAQTNGD